MTYQNSVLQDHADRFARPIKISSLIVKNHGIELREALEESADARTPKASREFRMALLQELRQLIALISVEQHPEISTFEEGEDTSTWIRAQKFVFFIGVMQTGEYYGLRQEAAQELINFAGLLRSANVKYVRGTDFSVFVRKVFEELVAIKRRIESRPAQNADLTVISDNIAAWFSANSIRRLHLIPCSIIPDMANSVEVGPVIFQHIASFDFVAFGVNPAMPDIFVSRFLETMGQRAATWVASIEIIDVEPVRSSETAGIIVDVALATLQLATPQELIDKSARITGRSLPPFVVALTRQNGEVSPTFSNYESGKLLRGEAFNNLTSSARPFFESAGRRINTLLLSSTECPQLELAWCNAAYWFHEALAEPLATVAIAKLETSIENLFGAGNPLESTNRILQALEGVFGLKPNDIISAGSSVKVKDFVKDVVTSRSRILHGTWSTLTEDLPLGRTEVEKLARQLLISFTLKLDEYVLTPSPPDKTKNFLDWITAERAAGSKASPLDHATSPTQKSP
ncbi:hypothetical protein [Methylobacterium sp. Leaf91]|uniref:hypothetical protein n=1 Tax=Methylobacterium sp. Leaf91 TaxID=1736247 RepID=UPI0012E75078|nr:hypothetical protein [Methylobacterium sp. Leaf91]